MSHIKDAKGNSYRLLNISGSLAYVTKMGGTSVMIARVSNGVIVEKPVYVKGFQA